MKNSICFNNGHNNDVYNFVFTYFIKYWILGNIFKSLVKIVGNGVFDSYSCYFNHFTKPSKMDRQKHQIKDEAL